ncbi:glucose dehydrogenase [FAD, quinone]-like isoform X2 [Pieris brassicae]|uniref:glucose dehydrogenase [FAD, quinone]-like isoform X2 n=1 Tax=Pieris brassicae TaxID=7116 RepID=UPI001E65FC14|nr:glucose dehydrogenase [FAD, quinone]-like isoform X2 [Pieris brassicae]
MSMFHILQYILISVCVYAFTAFIYLVYHTNQLYKAQHINSKDYDYIIGSGTAGSLVAHRIAKETNFTYVVIEAGGESNPLFEIPILGPMLHGSVYDWQYDTVPQTNACLAMEENKCKMTQGKIFGGSSKLNNMIHVRGNISHYVNWFHGKYTKKYIKEQFEYIEKNIIHLNPIKYTTELSDNILLAAQELGYELIGKDFKLGFTKPTVSQLNGKRWANSDNLEKKHVLINTFVEKLLIRNKRCYGVQLANKLRLYAKKGIIISAGALNSPKILQLSGVGPAELLKSFDIPILKELPVGKNLQDHIGTGLDLVLFNKSLSVNAFNCFNPIHIFQYFVEGQGPFTTAGCEVVGFLSTKNSTEPDIQFMVLPVGISADRGSHLRKILRIRDYVWDNYFTRVFDKHASTILALILHTKSKGEVNIQSRNPEMPPLIDPKYFQNRDDVDTLINAVKLTKTFVLSKKMKSFGAILNTIPFPGCESHLFFSDTYLECYIRHLTLSTFHPVGTCSMGLPDDYNSVVDPSFKVIGLDNLYVVDASVLPTLPSSNINAAVAMMANIFFENNIKQQRRQKNNNICFQRSLSDIFNNICPVNKVSL